MPTAAFCDPVDYRHFELQDLVSEALIAVEARRLREAETALRRLLAWVERDWLATPSDAAPSTTPAAPVNETDDD